MKIICNLPNASTLINGIPFEKNADGKLVSVDDVPEKMIPIFLSINGYFKVEEVKDDAPKTETPQPENAGLWNNGQGDDQWSEEPEGDVVGSTEKEQDAQTTDETGQTTETETPRPEKAGKKAASGKKN